jgi:hypothetical protein
VVNVAVCDKDLSEEGCPHSTSVKASAGFVEARFDKVPPGNYAVVGYHDENGNDEFDKFLGVPREPYALSNRAGEKMVPTFKDAALKIKQARTPSSSVFSACSAADERNDPRVYLFLEWCCIPSTSRRIAPWVTRPRNALVA